VNEIQFIGTLVAALAGLAFGSFLNVVLIRFPKDESIVSPRSHCRNCDHSLSWWENLPVFSWVLLRGRCRACRAGIPLRYPTTEVLIGLLWAGCWLRFSPPLYAANPVDAGTHVLLHGLATIAGNCILCWLLIALAALDAEYFWLPNLLTYPGIALGFVFTIEQAWSSHPAFLPENLLHAAWHGLLAILAACGLILFIRLAYWIVRREEGMGLGDAKLMAMLGAWLGIRGSMESFIVAMLVAAAAAFVWLLVLAIRRKTSQWARMPLPFGTFLAIAALIEIFHPLWMLGRMQLGF
jgi:leader peptidase (prepilin peptidase)/N-methyltransferase